MESTIREKAEEFNEIFFANELDLSKVKFSINERFKTTRGICRSDASTGKVEVEIARFLLRSEKETLSTILHELIHVWQFFKKMQDGHGRNFRAKSNEIYRRSQGEFNIKTRSRAEDKSVREYYDRYYSQRLINKIRTTAQYIVVRPEEKVNFLKNLTDYEIKKLKNLGFDVYRNNVFSTNVRHTRNVQSLSSVKYYYSLDDNNDILDNAIKL